MLVGISGPSCSGKTTLAKEIAALLGAPTFHLDRHFIEGAARPVVNGHPSFEQPDQYDAMALLDETVAALSDHEHVVVEGFLLLTYPGFTTVCDRMVHLDVPHETLARRRADRAAAKAALTDVKGGRLKAADDGWSSHGREEWLRYGACQARIPGVTVVRPGETHPSGQADIARALVADWPMMELRAA
jgi:uridine kinase